MPSVIYISRIYIGVECQTHKTNRLIGYDSPFRNPENIYELEPYLRICSNKHELCCCKIKTILAGHKDKMYYILPPLMTWNPEVLETKGMTHTELQAITDGITMIQYKNGSYTSLI